MTCLPSGSPQPNPMKQKIQQLQIRYGIWWSTVGCEWQKHESWLFRPYLVTTQQQNLNNTLQKGIIYILPHSVHPPGVLPGLVLGKMYYPLPMQWKKYKMKPETKVLQYDNSKRIQEKQTPSILSKSTSVGPSKWYPSATRTRTWPIWYWWANTLSTPQVYPRWSSISRPTKSLEISSLKASC